MSRDRRGHVSPNLSPLSRDACPRLVPALSSWSCKRLKDGRFGRGQYVHGQPVFALGRRRRGVCVYNTHPARPGRSADRGGQPRAAVKP